MRAVCLLWLLAVASCCAAIDASLRVSSETKAFQCLTDYAEQVGDLSPSITPVLLHRLWAQLANLSKSTPRPRGEFFIAVGPGTTGTRSLAHDWFGRGLKCPIHWLSAFGGCCQQQRQSWTSLVRPATRVGSTKRAPLRTMTAADIWAAFDRAFASECFGFVSDTPVAQLFLHLYHYFPDAKYIWSDRDPAAWAQSRLAHHGDTEIDLVQVQPREDEQWRHMDKPKRMAAFQQAFIAIRELVFCLVPSDRLLRFSYFDQSEQEINDAFTKFFPKQSNK